MIINVKYPLLKKSYKKTAKLNEDKLVERMEDLVLKHKRSKIHYQALQRGGMIKKSKKPKTFAL